MLIEYSPVPNDFIFDQAYPNPFNPTTTVQYGLPIDGKLTLAVYDLQGRKVNNLATGFVIKGFYEAVWDGTHNASGIYFIRLDIYDLENNEQFSKIQKIILVK